MDLSACEVLSICRLCEISFVKGAPSSLLTPKLAFPLSDITPAGQSAVAQTKVHSISNLAEPKQFPPGCVNIPSRFNASKTPFPPGRTALARL